MRYVCIDYNVEMNTVDICLFSDVNIDSKFTKNNQTIVVRKGREYVVQFANDDINCIKDFMTVVRFAYKGVCVNEAEPK